jgi:hypothetical protein
MKQENRSKAETPFTQDILGRFGKPWKADSKTRVKVSYAYLQLSILPIKVT